MNLELDKLVPMIARDAWVFLRLTGFMMTAPMLSNVLVPVRIRVILLVALTVLVAPLAARDSVPLGFDARSLLAAANELLVGAAIGFTVQIAIEALSFAGTLTALAMGLGFATLVDPMHRGDEPVVGQFYQILAILVYLAVDGHLVLLGTLIESFRWLPAGGGSLARESLWSMAGLGARLFASGLLIALPGVVALLIVNLALGVMSRAAPQLNLYAVGFPITVMFGMVVLIQALPAVRTGFEGVLRDSLGLAANLAGAR
jgi:flagellar biosynthetic protein FliR